MSSSKLPALDTISATFADFFRESPLGMKVLSPENQILYANRAAQEAIGRSEDALRQIKELELVHAADLYRFREEFKQVAAGETQYSEVEARHRHADGHWVPLLVTHLRMPASHWPPDWILEIGVDLTQRHELKQQVLYLQSKQLLGQMARGIAHDFNNLLGVMALKLEWLETRLRDDEEARRTLEDTNRVLDKMRNLSRDLTRFGRAQHIDTERVDLGQVIRSMQGYFGYVCPDSISLEFDLADDIPGINVAPVQLEQVLLNLVVNARDAILEKQSTGVIKISTALTSFDESDRDDVNPGRYARVEVRDDGIGVDAHLRDQIFEPFFSTKGAMGSGVGLSTVYAIVRDGRGYIDIQSETGKGTSIIIYLPVD